MNSLTEHVVNVPNEKLEGLGFVCIFVKDRDSSLTTQGLGNFGTFVCRLPGNLNPKTFLQTKFFPLIM